LQKKILIFFIKFKFTYFWSHHLKKFSPFSLKLIRYYWFVIYYINENKQREKSIWKCNFYRHMSIEDIFRSCCKRLNFIRKKIKFKFNIYIYIYIYIYILGRRGCSMTYTWRHCFSIGWIWQRAWQSCFAFFPSVANL